jgi:hypothetical protein
MELGLLVKIQFFEKNALLSRYARIQTVRHEV